jgi:L-alanine-DL-glutamate epimerase-like enolase superfamily enzyme
MVSAMSSRSTAVRIREVTLYFLPVETRVPLKFGSQVLREVTCARVRVIVEGIDGRAAEGWGETPLSVPWVWPSDLSFGERHEALKDFCLRLAKDFHAFGEAGHPLEIGFAYQRDRLGELHAEAHPEMPHLAALVCLSPFDIALYDAFGNLHGVKVFEALDSSWLDSDLGSYLEPAERFERRYPADYLVAPRSPLPVWHLVGGLDPLETDELTGDEPDDGYPVLLRDWIRRDGLKCLKVKLRGNDRDWDSTRLLKIGRIAEEEGIEWLTTDFNCTVTDPAYVNDILDHLRDEAPRIYGMILYVEQPFPYELEEHRIDVHSVSARKPLFMDESAHDWKFVRLGRALGWTGVALKTCKTMTGALLSLCWAKEHGMTLMVQDLTNPMLAQIPHVLLAAYAGTIMGVESNGMQFYPEASLLEEAVHPGLYRRREGVLDFLTLGNTGFGYRVKEIGRVLPPPASS